MGKTENEREKKRCEICSEVGNINIMATENHGNHSR